MSTTTTTAPMLSRLIDLEWSAAAWMRHPFVVDQRWVATDGKMMAWHNAPGMADTPDPGGHLNAIPRAGIRKGMDALDISSCITDDALNQRISHAVVRTLFRTEIVECEACDGSLRIDGAIDLGGVGIGAGYAGKLIAAGARIGLPFSWQPNKAAFPFNVVADGTTIHGFVMSTVLADDFAGERVEREP